MNFRTKAITKDCKKCDLKTKGTEKGPDSCGFGSSKATKLLIKTPGKIRNCNLIKEKS